HEYRAVAQLVGRGTEGEDAVVAVRPTVSYNRLKEAGRFATNVTFGELTIKQVSYRGIG
nr:hypothetical protein [Herpetosiphonaceae bacterium]